MLNEDINIVGDFEALLDPMKGLKDEPAKKVHVTGWNSDLH